EYAKAVVSYLGITINNIAEKNNSISRWANTKETIAGSFSRQALPIVWDYFESNPFSGSTGDWSNSVNYNLGVIKHCSFLNSAIPTNFSTSPLPNEESEEEDE
ncbi:MAG TPA: DNA methylase, partial [Aquificaceae bacterium]|nr:DNA methylase [Aquificaceae bacterium]